MCSPLTPCTFCPCSADLSGQAFAQQVALQWGDRVLTEFKNQVQQEKRMGIPSALFMEGLEEPQKAARVQKGFVQHVVIPLWSLMAEILPGLQVCLCVFVTTVPAITCRAVGSRSRCPTFSRQGCIIRANSGASRNRNNRTASSCAHCVTGVCRCFLAQPRCTFAILFSFVH